MVHAVVLRRQGSRRRSRSAREATDTMKKLFVAVICSAFMCGALGAVAADPSLYGPTGLVVMPTADSLGFGQANGFVNYLDFDGDDSTVFGANAGVGMGIELGIASLHNGGSETIVNAKWNLKRETLLTPGIAIGVIDITESLKGDMEPYVVLSKRLSVPASSVAVSGHLGYVAGDWDEVMIGASVDLTSKLQLMADYIDDFSIGARYAVTDDFKVGVSSVDGNMMLSASYRFGLK